MAAVQLTSIYRVKTVNRPFYYILYSVYVYFVCVEHIWLWYLGYSNILLENHKIFRVYRFMCPKRKRQAHVSFLFYLFLLQWNL